MDGNTVGVVGAGTMGTGVAQRLAQNGYRVVLVDRSPEAAAMAQKRIAASLRFGRLLGKPGPPADLNQVLGRITFTLEYDQLHPAFCVIENVTEQFPIKRDVYRALNAVCSAECIFAANTSAISITRIGSVSGRPDRVIGIHFMNPVPMKHTVELIPGLQTSAQTLAAIEQLLARMGMRYVTVNDSPGFVSNRVLMLMINEAVFLLHEQVTSPKNIDEVFKSCMGHPMGPLETADLIGLDTILYSLEVLYESFCDSKFRPCPLLRKMVDAGLYGRKNGRGFYTYESGA